MNINVFSKSFLYAGLFVAALYLALTGTRQDAVQSPKPPMLLSTASQDYDMPAGSLADHWLKICIDAHIACAVESSVIEKLTAAPVHGRMKPQQAIEQLLRGTGLELFEIGADSYSLRRMQHAITE